MRKNKLEKSTARSQWQNKTFLFSAKNQTLVTFYEARLLRNLYLGRLEAIL